MKETLCNPNLIELAIKFNFNGNLENLSLSLLQKWFREIHNIHINPLASVYQGYVKPHCYLMVIDYMPFRKKFETYDECLEYGLETAFEKFEEFKNN